MRKGKAGVCKCKLSPMAMGLALGLVWGLSVFITGLLAYHFSYGKPFVMAMSALYIGYEPSVSGSFIGGGFGFVDGLIVGVLIGWFYNCFVGCCSCVCSTKSKK